MRPAILLFIALFMSGCASVDNSKKTITLDSALRQYERAIRWANTRPPTVSEDSLQAALRIRPASSQSGSPPMTLSVKQNPRTAARHRLMW